MASDTDQFITIQVGSNTFRLPLQGRNPSWGEELTAIIEALADISQLIAGPNDILLSTANILNNQTNTNFSSVVFDTADVLSFRFEYFIVRTYDDGGTVTLTQSGFLDANFDGSDWKWTQEDVGDAGVEFSITAGGVLQYTSSDLTALGTPLSGTARYKATTTDTEE